MSTERAVKLLRNNHDFVRGVLLPELVARHRSGLVIETGLVGDVVGLCRRQCYNYLRALEVAGLVGRPVSYRRWVVRVRAGL